MSVDDRVKLQSAIAAIDNLRILLDLAFNKFLEVSRRDMPDATVDEINQLESLCLASRSYADSALAAAHAGPEQ